MGVVWKALDTKLDREIAIKILPEELAVDPERFGRFQREAKAVAALDHPNIVTVYSVEEEEGVHFITMGLVRGKSLSELIPTNGLPLGKFFDQAIALADAVSAAHQQGITHRDLKPDNVMIGDDGRLKVLDFGLAKLREEAQAVESSTQLPTATVTQEGKILGTVSYMSPEQAEGKAIDHRSDIFSLGVMLYQMATGQRPFKGDTSVSIISSIMKDTPASITDLNQTLPRHLGRIVKRCLAKDPLRRFQSALDLRNDLVELKEEIDSGELQPSEAAPDAEPRKRGRLVIALAAVVVAVVAFGYVWLNYIKEPREAGISALNPVLTRLTSQPGSETFPSLSPDGKTVIYASPATGNWDIYALRVGGENPLNLTLDTTENDTQPAFSPDGENIVFRSERDGGGIFVMGATGESPRRVTDFGYYPTWSPDGNKIAFVTAVFVSPRSGPFGSQLWVVDIETGARKSHHEGTVLQPHWSPNGHRIAYWIINEGGQRDILSVPATGGEPIPITDDEALDWNPVWSPDGRYLYFSSDRGGSMNLWRVPIDEASGEVLGRPQPVTTGVSGLSGYISFTRDGRQIAYASSTLTQNVQKITFDPASEKVGERPIPVTEGSVWVKSCDPSPDDELLACDSRGRQEDIFLIRADGSGRRQLTNDLNKDRYPRWSPDGGRIAFYSDRSGSYELWSIKRDGSGLRQLSDTPGRSTVFPVWSPDGKRIACLSEAPNDLRGAYLMETDKPGQEQSLQALPVGDEYRASFENDVVWSWSPDAQRLAGVVAAANNVDEGTFVYSLASQEYEVLTDIPSYPVWLNDNRRLLSSFESSLFLIDSESKRHHELLSIAPATINKYSVRLSSDNRTVYFSRIDEESDIWMLTLE
jgi:Tol biopolymer transport system component